MDEPSKPRLSRKGASAVGCTWPLRLSAMRHPDTGPVPKLWPAKPVATEQPDGAAGQGDGAWQRRAVHAPGPLVECLTYLLFACESHNTAQSDETL